MSNDPITDALVDGLRLIRRNEINSQPEITRESLEAQYGQVWDTSQLSAEFDVRGFMAPFVIVKRKSDGQMGSMEFSHLPRFYFNYIAD